MQVMIWLMLGTLVFLWEVVLALRQPPAEPLRLAVTAPDMEYRLWQAEFWVQLGRYGGVELVGEPPDTETAEICRLFMRRRPWIRYSGRVCKSVRGVLY